MNSLVSSRWGQELGNTRSDWWSCCQNDSPRICSFRSLGTFLKSKALLSLCNAFKKEGAKQGLCEMYSLRFSSRRTVNINDEVTKFTLRR